MCEYEIRKDITKDVKINVAIEYGSMLIFLEYNKKTFALLDTHSINFIKKSENEFTFDVDEAGGMKFYLCNRQIIKQYILSNIKKYKFTKNELFK